MKIPDTDTLLQFNKGNENALQFIFKKFYQELFYYTWQLSGCRQEAEDITLAAFQKLFERRGSFTAIDKIKAFLYITARNRCLNYLKTQKRLHEIKKQFAYKMVQDFFSGPAIELPETLLHCMSSAVDSLPRECRKILKLLYFDELKPKEVAGLLGLSIRTVYNQKRIGLKALRLQIPSLEQWQQ